MTVPVSAVDVVSQPRVDWRFVAPYVVATVAMWMSFNAPGQMEAPLIEENRGHVPHASRWR